MAASECKTADGAVTHANGKRATYGDLAAKAAGSEPKDIQLKDPRNFKLIGTPQPRRDSAAKVNGSAEFGLDVRPPGLLFAAVKMSPTIGGRLLKFDEAAVKSMPGVVRVVDFSRIAGGVSGLAVIAKSYWQAKQAAEAFPLTWKQGPNAKLTTSEVFRELSAKLDGEQGFAYYKSGDLEPRRRHDP